MSCSPSFLKSGRLLGVSVPRALRPGDHVRVWRGFYWHHAIYVGGEWFIEFGSGVLGGVVAWVGWEAFSRGNAVEVVQTGGPEAIARATSRLGRSGFDLVFFNCEHFATWCATGRAESRQVRAVLGGVLAILAVLAVRRAA